MFNHMKKSLLVMALGASWATTALASSHREAPAIAEDQFVDNTDVYAFISPNNPDNIVFVANYVPLLLPYSGPNFYKFSDRARYEICIDNDGDAIRDLCYRWEFNTTIQNGGTFLYNTGPVTALDSPTLNVRQTYTLSRVARTGRPTIIATGVPVAPWNVGNRTFPGTTYDTVANSAVRTMGTTTMFAGPRDEPFFVDLHVFDLLGVGGFPATDGVNVMSIVLEVPITEVAQNNQRPAAGSTGQNSVIGIYARALRPRASILAIDFEADSPGRFFGGFAQVSRLAIPLVNEVVVPLQDKDGYNRSLPHQDVAHFGSYILNPEVAILLNLVFVDGNGDPIFMCDDGGNRTDIVGILAPNGTTPADLLRININADQTFANSAFPNGRWLEDDVTDTMLTVACGGPGPVGDGVPANDLPFSTTFPFLASPVSGNPL